MQSIFDFCINDWCVTCCLITVLSVWKSEVDHTSESKVKKVVVARAKLQNLYIIICKIIILHLPSIANIIAIILYIVVFLTKTTTTFIISKYLPWKVMHVSLFYDIDNFYKRSPCSHGIQFIPFNLILSLLGLSPLVRETKRSGHLYLNTLYFGLLRKHFNIIIMWLAYFYLTKTILKIYSFFMN